MNEKRREILLGYLLGALEPQEEAKIERELQYNDSLQQDLAELYREIAPVMSVVHSYSPSPGLAKRTSQNIWKKVDSQQKPEVNSEKPSPEKPLAEKIPRPHFPERLPSRPNRHKITVEVAEATKQNFTVQKSETGTELPHVKQVVTHPVSVPPGHEEQTDHEEQGSETTHVVHSPHATPPLPLSAKSNMSALLSESPSLIITKQPKYYGKEVAVSQKKRPRKKWDVIASVFVGIVVSICLYFLWQNGTAYVREAIFQKKVREIGQNLPAGSSQYSTYGLSQNDLMLVNNMNIDSDSAARYQQLRSNNQQTEQPAPSDGKKQ